VVSSSPETSEVFRLLAVFVLLDFPSQALPAYLLARRAYRGFFTVTLLFSLSRFISLALPATLGATLPTIMGWFLVVAVVRLLMFLVYFLAFAKGNLAWSEVKPQELLGFGVPLSLSAIVGKLNIQADKYMVSLAAGREALATYTVGAAELPLVPSLAYSVTNSLVPTLSLAHARGDRESFIRYWHDSMIKVAEIMMPVFFFFSLLAGPAIRVLFSASFEAAVVPFRVYLLLLPLRLCAYGAVLRSLGETRAVFTSALAALAANLALILPLYYLLGLAGPALASVIGQLVIIGMLLKRIRAALGVSWSELLPYLPLRKTILTAGLSAIPLLAIAAWPAPDGLRLLIGAAVMVPLYLVLGRWTGVIAPRDLEYLWRLFTLGGLRGSGKNESKP
jgi:O-antigen/teichoic acid export membrane protein